MNKKLSADLLYHYTKSIDGLTGILSTGFRYSRLIEALPYKPGIKHALYVVCFCDLTLDDAANHRLSYGNYGIALKKTWGLTNGVSPVRYVHQTSPGSGLNYRIAKTLKYDYEEVYGDPVERSLALTSVLRCIHDQRLQGAEQTFPLVFEGDDVIRYGEELVSAFRDVQHPIADTFRRTYEALHMLISDLHNELELRDKFIRVYEERLGDDSIVRRYDEREWRASFIPTAEVAAVLQFGKSPNGSNQWVEEKYNLRFGSEDIVQLIVPCLEDAEILEGWLESHDKASLVQRIEIIGS